MRDNTYDVYDRAKKVECVRVAIGIAADEFNIRGLLFKFISFAIEMQGDLLSLNFRSTNALLRWPTTVTATANYSQHKPTYSQHKPKYSQRKSRNSQQNQ